MPISISMIVVSSQLVVAVADNVPRFDIARLPVWSGPRPAAKRGYDAAGGIEAKVVVQRHDRGVAQRCLGNIETNAKVWEQR